MSKGDCYKASALSPVLGVPGAKLVHGIPLGQGGPAKGLRFGHAWIEFKGVAIDPLGGGPIPVEEYYRIGRIKYTVRYTAKQTKKLIDKTGIYGPWDSKISKAVHRQDVQK